MREGGTDLGVEGIHIVPSRASIPGQVLPAVGNVGHLVLVGAGTVTST